MSAEAVVLETPHRSKCRGWGWCFVGPWRDRPGLIWRDRAGKKRGSNYMYLVLRCLDPDCPGEALVSERAVATFADLKLPARSGSGEGGA